MRANEENPILKLTEMAVDEDHQSTRRCLGKEKERIDKKW